MNKVAIRHRGVLKTSAVIAGFLIGAKLLNFVKKILIGQLFGVSWVADSFFAASYLPYYLAIFFEGVLFLGFLPLFSQIVHEKGEGEAREFASGVFFLVFFLTLLLVLAGGWLAPWLMRELVPGFTIERQHLTVSLFRVLVLVTVFLSFTSFFKTLNSYYGQYAVAASSGFIDTSVMIGWTLLAWKVWGIFGAAWGAVFGSAAACAFQVFPLLKNRPPLAAGFHFETIWLRKLFFFLLPLAAIWLFQQIPLVILNRFGSGMWQGTISALAISQTLTTVPMGLVSHTVLLAVFPVLARQANGVNREEARQTFFQTLRTSSLILIPAGFLLTAFARPLAVLFFDGGGITAEGIRRVANSLACFGWATFALYADLFMTQSLIALRKTRPAVLLCVIRALLTYGVCYLFTSLWDYQGLALGFSSALVLNFLIFFPLLLRRTPFSGEWGGLYLFLGKLVLASSPAFLAAIVVNRWSIFEWSAFSKLLTAAGLAAGCILTGGLYLVLLSSLRIREFYLLVQRLKESRNAKNWWFASQSE